MLCFTAIAKEKYLSIITFLNMGNLFQEANVNARYITRHILGAPSSKYLLYLYNRNTRERCEMCSKLTIKTSEQH